MSEMTGSPFTADRLERFVDALAGDDLFNRWARWFDATLMVHHDDDQAWFAFERGKITGFGVGSLPDLKPVAATPAAPVITLTGTADAWAQLWAGVPGGLHRAWRQQTLTFDADPAVVLRNYRALWQFGEVMVKGRWFAT